MGFAPATPSLFDQLIINTSQLRSSPQKGELTMSNRYRNLGINIRVTPAEKKKIERNARKCKLTVSEYLRQIAMKVEPKELPSEEIISSLQRLSEVSRYLSLASGSDTESDLRKNAAMIGEFLNRIYLETMQLMLHAGPEDEVMKDGND
jgi:hypothetical protein